MRSGELTPGRAGSDGEGETAGEVHREHALTEDVPTDQHVVMRGAGSKGSRPVVWDTDVLCAELQ